jgi:hypothetical protein
MWYLLYSAHCLPRLEVTDLDVLLYHAFKCCVCVSLLDHSWQLIECVRKQHTIFDPKFASGDWVCLFIVVVCRSNGISVISRRGWADL